MLDFKDLRGFLSILEKDNDLLEISGADPDKEISALTYLIGSKKEHPAVLFDNIEGYRRGFKLLTNFITTDRRSKIACGLPLNLSGDVVETLSAKLHDFHPISPREVNDGPVKENKMEGESVDASIFPAPLWHELDGGRYLGTTCLVITREPEEGWVNVGTYRLQYHDKKTLGIVANPGHHGAMILQRYWEKGQSCPVAVSLGHSPHLATAAEMYVPWGQCEYDYAGWLSGEPLEVIKGPHTGLPVPAYSEVLIEGDVAARSVESRVEGPFGEFAGYYSAESGPQPVLKIRRISYRNDPIVMGGAPFRGVRHDGTLPWALAVLMTNIRRAGLSDVRALARSGPFLVVSLRQRYAGHARRIADFIMSGSGMRPPKYLVIVDEDIDPTRPEQVAWAVNTRSDPSESIHFYRQRWGASTDPIIPPSKREVGDITASSAVIFACRPYPWRERFPKANEFTKEYLEIVSRRWASKIPLLKLS